MKLEFWDAVAKVKEVYPNEDEWDEMHWLMVIDLADCLCYHPVRFRRFKDGGLRVLSKNSPGFLQREIEKLTHGHRHKDPVFYTWCPVCSTECPAPPVDTRAKRKKELANLLRSSNPLV